MCNVDIYCNNLKVYNVLFILTQRSKPSIVGSLVQPLSRSTIDEYRIIMLRTVIHFLIFCM